jgi:PST family polysaccharide transporter
MLTKIKNIANTEDKKRLLSNFFSLSILQAFTYILPLLTLPYLVRVLGVDKFGLVMFAQAFIMFFNILVDYGFNLSATREVSIHRDDKNKLTEIFSSVMSIKAMLIFVSFFILTIVVFSFEKFSNDWELYYLSFLVVIGNAIFPIWYFQGIEKMKYITIVNITSKLIFTILIFVVIQEPSDYIYIPVLNGFGFIIGGITSLWIVYKNFNQSFIFQKYIVLKMYFIDSSQFFLSRVSATSYFTANVFILGLFTNTTMVGYYSIAEKLYGGIQSLYAPITQALYPYITKERNIKLFKKLFYLIISINIFGVIFLYIFGEYIFGLLFTQDIGIESIGVFHIFLVANLVAVPSVLIGYPFLGAFGFSSYANMSVIYSSLYHLVGLLVLIFVFKVTIYSIAILFVTTTMLECLIRIYGVKMKNLWKI